MTTTLLRRTLACGRYAVAACVFALAGSLAACTSDAEPTPGAPTTSASPSASATPSVDPAEAAKQANIEAAKARYIEYIARINEIAQDGMRDGYKRVLEFLGNSDMMEEAANYYRQAEALGLRQVGETKVSSIIVDEYVGNPLEDETQQVRISTCLDNSGVDVLKPDGASALYEETPPRLVVTGLMQLQSSGKWTVNEFVTTDKEC